ncbi:MAG TPA: hypothetical protein VFC42_14125 [Methylomirabilota bacterium]|jgi:hypothetical protein|nr:hypothetical protein [Methylomirabilota bacterium]
MSALVPLRALWVLWKRAARRLGELQSRLVLAVFYYLVLGPFCLLVRGRADPFAPAPGGWRDREDAPPTSPAEARRQF